MTEIGTEIGTGALWTVIIGLGAGSFLLRFSFLGLIGDRDLPAWVLRHLRYTGVAVIPALVAPLVVWPAATDGALDAPRLMAALVTVAVGLAFRNVIAAILAGGASLYLGLYLLG
ncbi:AzlD domain-containing protein [Roseovarius sp. LXJ103]|uniref:AzlD domain-containing protein n=1 Tax=Roseovarius carneus TaxID=2853164 RepID=UPI000D60EA15|nr:AzlD domain-containing protein [Roseovarius carneus]MBZ8118538.1 AzlD domain-containing protein [Roseovarius carneus]PWE35769.1 AzlD domain-containing protein [Pelagicola sp. LXJ1103]